MLEDMCSCLDLMRLWDVSAEKIADLMKENHLLAYYRKGSKDIDFSKINNEPILNKGVVNYKIVHRLSDNDIFDQGTRKILNSPTSYYYSLTIDEAKQVSKALNVSKPDSYYEPVYLYQDRGVIRPMLLHLEKDTMTEMARSLFFRVNDINLYAEKNSLPMLDPVIDKEIILMASQEQENTSDKRTNISTDKFFCREGNGWHIGFRDEKTVFSDYKYIRYISLLLDKPGANIAAMELIHTVDGNTFQSVHMSENDALREGLSLDRPAKDMEISDNRVKEIQILISKIEKETDPLVKRELKEELDTEINYLNKMNALVDNDGRPSRPPKKCILDEPEKKRAQSAVKKALNNAYASFKKSNLKKLAKHLEQNIRPSGNYDFCYQDLEMHWYIKF